MSKKVSRKNKKKSKPEPPPEKAFAFLSDKKSAAALVVSIVIISVIVGGIYLNFRAGSDGDNKQYIDRNIFFPKDEGKHIEPYEAWTLSLHLTTGSGAALSTTTTYTLLDDDTIKFISMTDHNSLTGKNFLSANIPGGIVSSSPDGLNLSWSMGPQSDSLYALKALQEGQPNSVYSYSMEHWDNGSKVMSLACTIYNQKSPVLYGSDGKMFFFDLGTLYGYFQPRVTVRGNMTLPDGSVHQVNGYGWMEHTWGYLSLTDMEVLHLQLRNDVDIRIIRAYSSGVPGLEYYYYIRPDGSFDITQWQPESVSSLYVLTDGSYTSIEPVQYYLYPESFEKAPWDPRQIACFPVQWRFISETHGLNIQVAASFPQQFTMTGGWSGSMSLHESLGSIGKGYANLNHVYRSTPNVTNVMNNRMRLDHPGDPTGVRANITNDISYEYIKLVYKVDGGDEISIGMVPVEMEINIWTATIPGFEKLGTVIEYRIELLDLAGTKVESDWYSYTIKVE